MQHYNSTVHGPAPGGALRVSPPGYTWATPTSRRRHAVTETPPVEAALDELRQFTGDAKIEMSELIILGAQAKLALLRARDNEPAERRRSLASLVLSGVLAVDPAAAAEVRKIRLGPRMIIAR
jgi:hypothetical protein